MRTKNTADIRLTTTCVSLRDQYHRALTNINTNDNL